MPTDDRVRFVTMYLAGDHSLAQLARQFDVSRKTAYKWISRYELEGWRGLRDRSRAPHSNSRSPPDEFVALILRSRMEHPHWGPRKLRSWLTTKHPSVDFPAPSTIGEILKRNGLVEKRKRRRKAPRYEEPFGGCVDPNHVWCTDFKGHFKMGNGVRCHPLTLMDGASRYLLRCKGMSGPTFARTRRVFEAAFCEFGLPDAIRSDNGVPFAGRGAGGLSRLSAWWSVWESCQKESTGDDRTKMGGTNECIERSNSTLPRRRRLTCSSNNERSTTFGLNTMRNVRTSRSTTFPLRLSIALRRVLIPTANRSSSIRMGLRYGGL